MRPRNPRFISIRDQFSFFVTHHIPNPLSSGFEFPFHHRLCRNWLVPTTVCGSALLCLECAPTPVPPSLGWLLFILPDWKHHFLWKGFLHSQVNAHAEPYFCKQTDDDIRMQLGVISGSPQNYNLKSRPWGGSPPRTLSQLGFQIAVNGTSQHCSSLDVGCWPSLMMYICCYFSLLFLFLSF